MPQCAVSVVAGNLLAVMGISCMVDIYDCTALGLEGFSSTVREGLINFDITELKLYTLYIIKIFSNIFYVWFVFLLHQICVKCVDLIK